MLGQALSKYFNWVQFNPQKPFMRSRLKPIVHVIQGRVLDIGAGDAPYKFLFRSATEYITTNTKSHYSEAQADSLVPITDHWIDDGSHLPFPDAEFDCVCAFQVLSVIADPQAFFNEIYRVLKPGGILVISTDFLYPSWSKDDVMHQTSTGLERLAQESGFKIESIQSFGGVGMTIYMLVQNYFRSYPRKLKEGAWGKRLFSMLALPTGMAFSALLSLLGLITYILERNSETSYKYTFNLILHAKK